VDDVRAVAYRQGGHVQAYVTGAGKTRFGPSTNSLVQLAHAAITEALRDAAVTPDAIGALVVGNFLGGPNEGQLHLGSVLTGLFPGLHLPSWRVEAACASGGVALHQALLAVQEYGTVLVVGVERMSNVVGNELTRNIGMAGDTILDQAVGLNFPASYALVAQSHMSAYGTTTRDLELISLKSHRNANLNPKAHFYHKHVSQADLDAGPMVASPLRLFDCCPVSDGAAAVVVSATRVDSRSVPVLASVVRSDAISLVQRATRTSFPAAVLAARVAYEQAGIGPKDLDVAEVHDCFTIAEIVATEDIALCAPGEGASLARDGLTSVGGRIAVNASGGLKAGGHAIGATGLGQVYEIVTQLRGEAGDRQVVGARVGLAHNVGGVGGTCAIHILGGR
jgi:acetyl-CoA C-acetyltransferase